MSRAVIATEGAPKAVGHYVQAIKINDTLYTSGVIGADPATGKAPEGIKEQTQNVMRSIGNILAEAGFTKEEVVKCTCYIDDMDKFQEFNNEYKAFFGEHKPCRACVQCGMVPPFHVEIDCIAVHSH